LIHGVKVALTMGTDRIFFLGSVLLAAALVTLFFLKEIALRKGMGDVQPVGGAAASLNRVSQGAVLGLLLARRAASGGFRDDAERQQARELAVTLLRQYLTYQEAVSVGQNETAATTTQASVQSWS
jgi:hypothetical protein